MYQKISMVDGEYFEAKILDMNIENIKQGLQYCDCLLAHNQRLHRKNRCDLRVMSQEYANLENLYLETFSDIMHKHDELLVALQVKLRVPYTKGNDERQL